MNKRIEEYPHFAQPVDPNSGLCQHLVTRLGQEQPCWRTLRVGLWGGVPLCPHHRKQVQAWLDEAFVGSPAEVWRWLAENGRRHPALRATRLAPEGYAIFLSRGKVGYESLYAEGNFHTPTGYYLGMPSFNARRRTDGRWIDREARLVVKRAD